MGTRRTRAAWDAPGHACGVTFRGAAAASEGFFGDEGFFFFGPARKRDPLKKSFSWKSCEKQGFALQTSDAVGKLAVRSDRVYLGSFDSCSLQCSPLASNLWFCLSLGVVVITGARATANRPQNWLFKTQSQEPPFVLYLKDFRTFLNFVR